NTYYFYQRGWTGINIEPTPGQTFLSVDVEEMELEVPESHDWDRFRPHFVAVEWLEPLSVKEAISSGVYRFLEQQKYDPISKTPATLIFWEKETTDSRIR